MWKLIRQLLRAESAGLIVGKIDGHAVTRNPLRLLGIVVLLPLFVLAAVVVVPLYLLVMAATLFHRAVAGHNARFGDTGITVYSRWKGEIAHLGWAQIRHLQRRRDGPVLIWVVVLDSGERVPLHMANDAAVRAASQAHAIERIEEPSDD